MNSEGLPHRIRSVVFPIAYVKGFLHRTRLGVFPIEYVQGVFPIEYYKLHPLNLGKDFF